MTVFREARENDCEALFKIRNHPDIRSRSLNDSEILFSDHAKWFTSTLKSKEKKIFVLEAEVNQTIIGSIRLDFDTLEKSATVNIYVSPEFWGQGYAGQLLQNSESYLRDHCTQIKFLKAVVLNNNEASKKIFSKNHYQLKTLNFEKYL